MSTIFSEISKCFIFLIENITTLTPTDKKHLIIGGSSKFPITSTKTESDDMKIAFIELLPVTVNMNFALDHISAVSLTVKMRSGAVFHLISGNLVFAASNNSLKL